MYRTSWLATVTVVIASVLPLSRGLTQEVSYRSITLLVLTNTKLAQSADQPLQEGIAELIAPFRDEAGCPVAAFFPDAKLIRYDLTPRYFRTFQETSDVKMLEAEAFEGLNAIQKLFKKRPDYEQVRAVAVGKLKNEKSGPGLAAESPGEGDIGAVIEQGKEVFVIPPSGEDGQEIVQSLVDRGVTSVHLMPVPNPKIFHATIAQKLCVAGAKRVAEVPKVTVLYSPHLAKVVQNGLESPPKDPANEAVQYLRQGLTYISLGKAARLAGEKKENYENASASFSEAVRTENVRGNCYANAYMNRGLVYALQEKPRLALRDLTKAAECDPKDATIRYNLAAVYSLAGDNDLAIEAMDQALDRGFSDCDALRNDPDLKNVRKMPEYKKTLEKHKLFCF